MREADGSIFEFDEDPEQDSLHNPPRSESALREAIPPAADSIRRDQAGHDGTPSGDTRCTAGTVGRPLMPPTLLLGIDRTLSKRRVGED